MMLFISIWARRFDGVVVFFGFGFFYIFELDVLNNYGLSDGVRLPIRDQINLIFKTGITDEFLAGAIKRSCCAVARAGAYIVILTRRVGFKGIAPAVHGWELTRYLEREMPIAGSVDDAYKMFKIGRSELYCFRGKIVPGFVVGEFLVADCYVVIRVVQLGIATTH